MVGTARIVPPFLSGRAVVHGPSAMYISMTIPRVDGSFPSALGAILVVSFHFFGLHSALGKERADDV